MKTLRFIIPIAPQSIQGGSRYGRGRFYSDPAKKIYYSKIAEEVKHLVPSEPFAGPLEIGFAFFLERPKTVALPTDDPEPPVWSNGDRSSNWDNLVKGTQDALEKARLFYNDGQIWKCLGVESRYCAIDGFPRIEVTLNYEENYKKEEVRNKSSSGKKNKASKPKIRPNKGEDFFL